MKLCHKIVYLDFYPSSPLFYTRWNKFVNQYYCISVFFSFIKRRDIYKIVGPVLFIIKTKAARAQLFMLKINV